MNPALSATKKYYGTRKSWANPALSYSKVTQEVRKNKAKVSAIVVSAGKGKRLKGFALEKPYLTLINKPILVHTLLTIAKSPFIKSIILVVNKKNISRAIALVKKYKIKKVKKIIIGGKERLHSVFNGLKEVDLDTDLVAIHDGVRPLLSSRDLSNCIKEACLHGAAILAVPASDTVKELGRSQLIKKTLNRKNIFLAQTPQVFKYRLLLNAYRKAFQKKRQFVTDDATLIERIGEGVKVVRGSFTNIKITTNDDFLAAEAFLKNKRSY